MVGHLRGSPGDAFGTSGLRPVSWCPSCDLITSTRTAGTRWVGAASLLVLPRSPRLVPPSQTLLFLPALLRAFTSSPPQLGGFLFTSGPDTDFLVLFPLSQSPTYS